MEPVDLKKNVVSDKKYETSPDGCSPHPMDPAPSLSAARSLVPRPLEALPDGNELCNI